VSPCVIFVICRRFYAPAGRAVLHEHQHLTFI
jgi:hypothetical protein